ncbi:MAG TPA: DUF1559 domain-containing protein, partial [Planctomycetaceae bacterium]|nr:DUF1559 domain-containing protein [Planctomycetaceae bacterium]
LEQEALFNKMQVDQLTLKQVLADPVLRLNLQTPISVFICPSDNSGPLMDGGLMNGGSGRHMNGLSGVGNAFRVSKSNYIGVCGYNDPNRLNANGQKGMFHRGRHYAFRDITDGTSNTFLVGERNKFCAQGAWAGNRNPTGGGPQGCDYTLGRTSMPINLDNNNSHWCTEGFASEHSGGAQFLMGDGSVQFISENIDFNNHPNATDRLRDGNGPNRTGWSKQTVAPILGTYQRLGNRDDGQTIRPLN